MSSAVESCAYRPKRGEVKNTYCPRLWNEFFINSNGNVYTCCHHKPQKLGNIYNEKLSEIYNNKKIKKLRKESLEGKLSCYKKCNLLSKDEQKNYIFKELSVTIQDLRRLKIVFGEGCNINCIMCWQHSKSKKMLDFDVLKKNIDLQDFDLLDLQGGEPLYIKSCLKYFSYATNCNIDISILTNGTLMNNEIANNLMKSSRSIKISLNAGTKKIHELVNKGSNWDRVLENIQFLRNFRKKVNPNFLIIGHMTIVIENLNDIENFIRNSDKIGFDEIEFGYDFRVPIYLNIFRRKKQKLRESISLLLQEKEITIKIRKLRLLKLGLIKTS